MYGKGMKEEQGSVTFLEFGTSLVMFAQTFWLPVQYLDILFCSINCVFSTVWFGSIKVIYIKDRE